MGIAHEDLLSEAAWRQVQGRLREWESLVLDSGVPASPRDRAEGWRYLLRFLAASIRACIVAGDPDYPEFGRIIERGLAWGFDNPDCNYSATRVRGDASYRIGGNVGSARHFEYQVNTGHLGDGNVGGWQTVSSLHAGELQTDADGNFELILSAQPHEGNWMALDEEASFLFLRQYFEDWENERPARVFVERIGAEYPEPALTPQRLAPRIDELLEWLSVGIRSWEAMSRLILGTEANAVTLTEPMEGNAGLRGQAYGLGHFRCAPDEAVILEFKPPACRMWSVQLCGWFWDSLEFATRQSSINSAQAEIDSDGIFRAVIAHDDPGVANWLDPVEREEGSIGIRYLFPDVVTQPAFRVLKRSELDGVLPADTKRLGPGERGRRLARRRRAVQLRYGY
ncbi:MAG: DUF1214 domain-containing protein [Deltaproteobacteria bacterium]